MWCRSRPIDRFGVLAHIKKTALRDTYFSSLLVLDHEQLSVVKFAVDQIDYRIFALVQMRRRPVVSDSKGLMAGGQRVKLSTRGDVVAVSGAH